MPEDYLHEAEEARRAFSEELHKLNSLQEHAGWKRYTEILDGQLEVRIPSCMRPLENILEVPKQEGEKGEYAGIKIARTLVDDRINDLRERIKIIDEEIEDARSSTESVPTAGGESRDTGDSFEPATP